MRDDVVTSKGRGMMYGRMNNKKKRRRYIISYHIIHGGDERE